MNYQQCRLRRGDSETTAWIESRGARVGSRVELLPSRDEWDVVEVFTHAMPADDLREMQRQHRGSLPSIERMV